MTGKGKRTNLKGDATSGLLANSDIKENLWIFGHFGPEASELAAQHALEFLHC